MRASTVAREKPVRFAGPDHGFHLLAIFACMTLKYVEAKEDVRQSLLLSVVQSAGLPVLVEQVMVEKDIDDNVLTESLNLTVYSEGSQS